MQICRGGQQGPLDDHFVAVSSFALHPSAEPMTVYAKTLRSPPSHQQRRLPQDRLSQAGGGVPRPRLIAPLLCSQAPAPIPLLASCLLHCTDPSHRVGLCRPVNLHPFLSLPLLRQSLLCQMNRPSFNERAVTCSISIILHHLSPSSLSTDINIFYCHNPLARAPYYPSTHPFQLRGTSL